MARFVLFLVLWLGASGVFAQQAGLAEQASPERRRDVSFTHHPFLLIKIMPTAALGTANTFMGGLELAPPFGKFSFNADYGVGWGKYNIRKAVREGFREQKTTQWRAELRAYFSDMYPFYALDKKPFGRYYALEYVNTTQTTPLALRRNDVPGVSGNTLERREMAVHLKYGKHFIINRHFFIDGFIGLGPGLRRSAETPVALTGEQATGYQFGASPALVPVQAGTFVPTSGGQAPGEDYQVLYKPGSMPDALRKGLFFSKTAGVRLCFVL